MTSQALNRSQRRKQQKDELKRMHAVLLQGSVYEKLKCGVTLQKKSDFKKAMRFYNSALHDNPTDADALNLKGGLLLKLEKYPEAEKVLQECLQHNKDFAPVHHNLGLAYLEQGAFELAEKHLGYAHELNPQSEATLFYMGMAKNRNNNKASPEYVKQLYEAGATVFEENLVQNLKYSAPTKLMAKLKNHINPPLEKTLDLGCGTGLMGVELKPFSQEITGVDIAENMIKEAEKKGCYKALTAEPLEAYLENTQESFDLITAADVIIYLGPLDKFFAGAYKRLKKNGLLGFTTERLDEAFADDIWLNAKTDRHKHKDSYIKHQADKYGFKMVCLEKDFSRYENKKAVDAAYIILRRE